MKEVKVMKKRDKLNCQEIKELILNNSLSLSALSESSLRNLIEYEAECLMERETEYDTTFMDLCTNALIKIQNTTSVPSDEKLKEIGERAYREYLNEDSNQNDFSMPTTALPPRKLVRILIAAAIITALLTVSAVACWNPFSNWFADIHDKLDVKHGEIIENEHGSFTSDKYAQSFASIAEMEKTLGIEFEVLDAISSTPSSIRLTQLGDKKEIWLEYKINENKLKFTIYLENAPYYKESLQQTDCDKITFCKLDWYVISQDSVTTIAFDNDYVYTISADSLDTIKTFMKGK